MFEWAPEHCGDNGVSGLVDGRASEQVGRDGLQGWQCFDEVIDNDLAPLTTRLSSRVANQLFDAGSAPTLGSSGYLGEVYSLENFPEVPTQNTKARSFVR